MTAREYAELQAFHRIEPFGSERQDYRIAIMAAAIVQAWSGERMTLSDFIPRRPGDEPEQTPEEICDILDSLLPVQHGHDRQPEHHA